MSAMPPSNPGTVGHDRARRRAVLAVALATLLVGSALVVYGLPSAAGAAVPGASAHVAVGSAVPPRPTVGAPLVSGAAHGANLAPHPAGAAPSSGRGVFLETQNLTPVAPANISCLRPDYYSPTTTCANTTFDPSINATASGTLGVAYSAFTNYTNCPTPLTNDSYIDVAFQSSTTGGTSWSTPVYLGNENCSNQANVTQQWQPSLTSLANGTFVLAYVMMGTQPCTGVLYCSNATPPQMYPGDIAYDALVVQESYNGGTTWTAPQIINQTYNPTAAPGNNGYCLTSSANPAYLPSIAASGNDVYLAWENVSTVGCSYSAGVHYVYSTNGGATWSAEAEMPGIGGAMFGTSTWYTADPYVYAASNGQVYLAYATALNETLVTDCVGGTCFSTYVDTMDVMVANATIGTGSFTVRMAGMNEPFELGDPGPYDSYNEYSALTPHIAWNGVDDQLYLVYNSEVFVIASCGSGCISIYFDYPTTFQNSSDLGVTWSPAEQVGALVGPGSGYVQEYQPTISVDHNGTIQVSFFVMNDTFYPGTGLEVNLNSTDDGTSWNGPYAMSPFSSSYYDDAYFGEYGSSTVAPDGQTFFAWTGSQCPVSSAYCYWMNPGQPEPNTTVAVSWMFQGTGISVHFDETNLTIGANWTASLSGNVRSGAAGTTLSVSGVPTGSPLDWLVPWVNTSYGKAWSPTPGATNPTPPASLSTNTTLHFTFSENILLQVLINPSLDPYYVTASPYPESNFVMTPLPGQYWYPANSSATLTVSNQAIACSLFCDYANLSWIAWTGMGNGSVSTNATTVTVTLGTAPVNETANFLWLAFCEGFSGTLNCYPTNGYPLTYHESGLPAGTAWNVTTVANGSFDGTETNGSTTPTVQAVIGQTAASYTVWTVPAAGGQVWVPTSTTPESPVTAPRQTLVNVTYQLEDPTTQTFNADVTALGLPNGTAWSAEVGASSYAVTSGNLSIPVQGGVGLNLTGLPVYTENGVGYYAASVSVLPYVMNTTWQNTTTLPDAFTFDGSARVIVQYEPMYWLSVDASVGGSVTGSSQWVPDGSGVTLTAVPDTGDHLLGWTGAGPGATSSANAHNLTVTLHPSGPVTEFATFRPNPAPTWNVTVTAVGLPSGTSFGFTLGSTSYATTNASTTVGELENGTYAFAAVDEYAADSNGTRWVPTSWNGSFGVPGPSGLVIQSNGSIQVNFTTQYVLTVASTPDGTVSPAGLVGATWVDAGTTVNLTATPAYHYKFAGWNASGTGSRVGPSPTIALVPAGPVWETATFVYRVFPLPAVYTLEVTESGLPSGTWWNVTAGSANASAAGPAPTLNLTGLNGSYALTVATVYTTLGTRYVANGSAPVPETVTQNRTASIAFAEQFALTVTAGQGGNATGAGTTWVASGASETLTATAASGYTFVSWNGTGTGSYSGTSANPPALTVGGPVNETANFAPVVPKAASGSSTAGQPVALGLLAVLLVVGLIVGLLLGRRGSRGGSTPSEGADASDAAAEAPAEDTYGGTPPGGGDEAGPADGETAP